MHGITIMGISGYAELTGPVSFHVLPTDGHEQRCHQDQLHLHTVDVQIPDRPVELDDLATPASPQVVTPTASSSTLSTSNEAGTKLDYSHYG